MLKIAWSSIFRHPVHEGHRFPMEKYDLIPEQLIYEGTISKENLFEPIPLEEDIILKTHCNEYWEQLSSLKLDKRAQRKTGFIHDEALIVREQCIMHGTLQASLFALEYGVGMNVAGGTHHAFKDRGEGFCLLNDIAISANYLIETGAVKKVLVVDLDVHQGNGTAALFEGNQAVFTFSMHGKKNYPLHKEKSDLDIELEDGTTDSQYLTILSKQLPQSIESYKPDFIFYQSGVDVLATDKLGRLGMTIQGCKERDAIVLEACKQHNIPVCISMGGGYSEHIRDIVDAHANTYRLVTEIIL